MISAQLDKIIMFHRLLILFIVLFNYMQSVQKEALLLTRVNKTMIP